MGIMGMVDTFDPHLARVRPWWPSWAKLPARTATPIGCPAPHRPAAHRGRSGPGGAPMSIRSAPFGVQTDDDPLDLDTAREYLAATALRPAPVGGVGLELERHVVDVSRPSAVVGWARLLGVLRGVALPGRSRLTVEPGGQVELSTPPARDVAAAVYALQADDAELRTVLAEAGLGLVGLGADPLRPPVLVHPGERYAAMVGYFTAMSYQRDAAAMMCSTASLQLNLNE